jgi:hypothetical protein
LNSTDPLGLSPATNALDAAETALDAREAAAVLNPDGANLAAVRALSQRVASDAATAQAQAIKQYVDATTTPKSGAGVITVCGNLALVQVCASETASGEQYTSVGVGVGIPGISANLGNVRGESPDEAALGWTTCVDVGFFIGGEQCWTNGGNASTKSAEITYGPSGGVWVMFGRRD